MATEIKNQTSENKTEQSVEVSPAIQVIPMPPLPWRAHARRFLANLPVLIPSIKRDRERKALILHLGQRREFWREAIDELECLKKPRHVSKEILDGLKSIHEIEDEDNDRIDLDIKRAREKCNTELSRIKARIDAVEMQPLIKQADKYGITVPEFIHIDLSNGERYVPTSWLRYAEYREIEWTNKEKSDLRAAVDAKREDRRKQRAGRIDNWGKIIGALTGLIGTIIALVLALKK